MILEHITERQDFRNAIADTLFQLFKIDALCLYPGLLLPVLSTGIRSVIIVDIGLHESRAVAVFGSRVLLTTLTIIPIGASLVLGAGTVAEIDASGKLAQIERQLLTNDVDRSEELEKLLGSGEWAQDEFGGLAGMLLDCLAKCPVDVSSVVASHVVFCGGGASIAGLTREIERVAVENYTTLEKYKALRVLMPANPDSQIAEDVCFPPHLLAWVGGSLLASCKGVQSRFVKESVVGRTVVSIDVPDWLSTHSEDWKFLAPSRVVNI